ncbi:MAG: DHA2 family efflux MFS transporter permease subunit [Slackia sp.]|nr:DHA2 family efflux MFS transporter permease subunit [Slackia sp.]
MSSASIQTEPKKTTRHEILVVAVVIAGAFLAILNQTVLAPALPGLMEAFQVNAGTAQWVTSIYMLVNGIMVPISAYLIDKFPTRKLFFASMVVFIAGTVLCAVAPSFEVLIVGRILQAAGAGVQMPLVAVVPMLVFPPEKRGTAMGMAGIVMSVAPAAGPVVAGMIIDSMGWRAMFWSIAPLGLIVLIASFFLLSNVGELKNPRLDMPSVILSTVAFGGLLYGFSSASTLGWTNPIVIAVIVIGAVCFVLFVMRQKKLDEPLLQLATLKSDVFASSAIIVTLINCAAAVTNVTLPIFLQNVLGASAMETGMVMMPAAAVGIIISPLSGVIFDKFGPRGITVGGLLIMTVALFGFSRIGSDTTLFIAAALCTMMAAGQTMANMPANTWGINALSNDMIAHGNAISNTGRQVGGAISTALIVTVMTMVSSQNAALGAVESTAVGVQAAYGACALVGAVTLVFAIVKVRSKKKEA